MTNTSTGGNPLSHVHTGRLFAGSCVSLISTAVAFSVVTSLLSQLQTQFGLTALNTGLIGGATIWGFAVSIILLGPLVDAVGMRTLMWFAFLCHTAGVVLMVFANGFAMLFIGGLILSLGNGTVEGVCNPLVATLFPDSKVGKLNRFHMYYPAGLVAGGLACYALDLLLPAGREFWTLGQLSIHAWQAKLGLVLLPTLIYGVLFAGQKFPLTERVQSGVSFGGMVRATFLRPLFLLLFFCMMLTASLELGPGRWMNDAMKSAMSFAGTNAGILMLVYISGLMAVLRYFAGPVVHKLSPTGLLLASAVLSGAGLFLLTHVQSPAAVIAAGTVFACGICYFWPTMLGVASERVPKGGALALGLLGGTGMAIVGLVTVPLMGAITDHYVEARLDARQAGLVLAQAERDLPALKVAAANKETAAAVQDAIDRSAAIIKRQAAEGKLDNTDAAKALRAVVLAAPNSPVGDAASKVVGPADQVGTLMSFRWVSSAAVVLVVVFGLLYLTDRARGGYKAESIAG